MNKLYFQYGETRKSECIASIAATVLHKTYSSLNVTEDYSQINNYLVHMMRFI